MKHRIPKYLHTIFKEYITDDEITEWLNDCLYPGDYSTWSIDYNTMELEIKDATQSYNIKEFFNDVKEFFEDEDLETAE